MCFATEYILQFRCHRSCAHGLWLCHVVLWLGFPSQTAASASSSAVDGLRDVLAPACSSGMLCWSQAPPSAVYHSNDIIATLQHLLAGFVEDKKRLGLCAAPLHGLILSRAGRRRARPAFGTHTHQGADAGVCAPRLAAWLSGAFSELSALVGISGLCWKSVYQSRHDGQGVCAFGGRIVRPVGPSGLALDSK